MALKVHPQILAVDEEFRAQSEATREMFGKLSPVEFTQMQKNFIEACGGKFLAQTSGKNFMRTFGKTYSMEDIRRAYPNAYRSWSEDEDKNLALFHEQGMSVKAIANRLGRQRGSIRSRLIKIGLI
jgi:DNA-binding NarL/FixJ family response regulator